MTPYEKVMAALSERSLLVSSWGTGQRARCPAHDDTRPSLSVAEGDDGRALVYCFAGCTYADVLLALGLSHSDFLPGDSTRDTPVAQYIYTDENGQPLSRVTRTEPKGFFQERWEEGEWKLGLRDTKRVLYNLPQLVRADTVWVVEGEKDVYSLAAEGQVATTCLGGSSNWRDTYGEYLRGKDVIIVGDRDEAGAHYVSAVRLDVQNYARSVRVLEVHPSCKDVTDHLQQGFTLDELTPAKTDLAEEFGEVDWETYEVEDTEWLFEPYVPVGGRTLVFGPRGSLKSLWAMWVAAHLSKEGKKVAYFSIEMQPSDTVRRIRQTVAKKENFQVFTRNLDLTNERHVDQLMLGLKGFDLIVIDSWSSVHQLGSKRMTQNDEVAWLDKSVILPLIERTGAAIMMIDNAGWEDPKAPLSTEPHVRGASAKEDKQEVCLSFKRPNRLDNYTTTLTVTKMRLDCPMPDPVTISTPQDRIEFYEVNDPHHRSHWPGMRVAIEPMDVLETSTPGPASSETSGLTPFEERKLARLKDMFGAKEVQT